MYQFKVINQRTHLQEESLSTSVSKSLKDSSTHVSETNEELSANESE